MSVSCAEVNPESDENTLSRKCLSSRKGLLPVKSGRQALSLCLGAVVAAVEVLDELAFEITHGIEFLQVQLPLRLLLWRIPFAFGILRY